MGEPYTGGCACGAIRYHVVGEPAVMNLCQCRQCQRDSGAGHGAHLTFSGAAVTLTGDAREWTVTGENGTRKSRGFCPACGAPAYIRFPDVADLFVVSAGSLDQPERYRPQMVMWTAAGHEWDRLDPALARFDKLPPAAG